MKINYCKHKCTLNTTPTTIPKNKKNDFNTSTKLKYAHHVRTSTFLNVYEGAPYDIVTQNVNNSTVKFNFKYIGKPNYYLVIITNKTNPTETQTITLRKPIYVFRNLQLNTMYNLTVISVYVSANKYSTVLIGAFRTLNEGPPKDLLVDYSKQNNKNITVIFQNAPGYVDQYTITVLNANTSIYVISNYHFLKEYPIDVGFYTISNLSINTQYIITVTTNYNNSKNQYSSTIFATTYYEDAPYDITFSNITNSTVTVQFFFIGNPIYFTISLINNNYETNEQFVVQTNQPIYIFSKLMFSSTYDVLVSSTYSHTGNPDNIYTTSIKNAFVTNIQ